MRFSTRSKISSNRTNDRSWMIGQGRLATGERRNSHVLTKCQNAGANDWPWRARLDSAEPRMEEREGVMCPNSPDDEEC
jgi:hypothetical protein